MTLPYIKSSELFILASSTQDRLQQEMLDASRALIAEKLLTEAKKGKLSLTFCEADITMMLNSSDTFEKYFPLAFSLMEPPKMRRSILLELEKELLEMGYSCAIKYDTLLIRIIPADGPE